MNYIPVVIFSYVLNGVAVLTDKFLLNKRIPDPLAYVFSISTLSMLGLIFIPFVPRPNSLSTFILASESTLIWTTGAYFMFKALKIGQPSRVAPVIGTLVPVFLIGYYAFVDRTLSLNDFWGSVILTLGMVLLILPNLRSQSQVKHQWREIGYELLAGALFAASYILLKDVFNQVSFLTGYIWSKLILLPIIAIILLVPALKKIITAPGGQAINYKSKTGLIFLAGQTSGGVSAILLNFSLSLTSPAVVNSLQGTQYAFLFLANLGLSRKFPQVFQEGLSKKILLLKFVGIMLLCFGLFILAFDKQPAHSAQLGITYSPRYAQSLGLDPKLTFISILDDLKVKYLRLPIYWDELQPDSPSQFNFSANDFYVNLAKARHLHLTLVIGFKVPRYPECFSPAWAKNLSSDQFDQALFQEIATVVNHYRSSSGLEIWQVENEPLFPFGVCPGINYSRLEQEVKLVHRLDPAHPVMVTESGEFGLWLTTANLSNIVGTTLYRKTLAPALPQFVSPLPPFFYQLKGMLVHLFFPQRKIFVSELQGEPWTDQPIQQASLSYQETAFSPQDLADNVEFTKQAGFNRVYLWGVEWWYYLKSIGISDYVNEAEMIWKNND